MCYPVQEHLPEDFSCGEVPTGKPIFHFGKTEEIAPNVYTISNIFSRSILIIHDQHLNKL